MTRKVFSCGAVIDVPDKEPEPLLSKKTKHKQEKKRKSKLPKQVTAIIVNFKTLELTYNAVFTFRSVYPNVPIILVDNHSQDDSTNLCKQLAKEDKNIQFVQHNSNVGHGPAMHNAVKLVSTPYFFTLDSDCEVHSPGFLQEMLEKFRCNKNLYAVGWRRFVDKISGVPREWHLKHPPPEQFIPYIHPAAAMFDRKKYLSLEPFFDHGAPCLNNMRSAVKKGYDLEPFPILKNHITHLVAGTRRMYKGHWHPKESQKPSAWNKKHTFPI